MSELLDLFHLVKSKTPLITIETRDEKEAVQLIASLGATLRRPVYGWNVVKGFSLLDKYGNIDGANRLEPTEVLVAILEKYKSSLFVLEDYHPYLQDNRIVRLIKEIALNVERLNHTIFFVSTQIELPDDIKHLSAKFDMEFPSEEIKEFVMQIIEQWMREGTRKNVEVDQSILDVFIKNLQGLSFSEIKRIVYNALTDNAINKDDIPEITKAKYELLNKTNVLYYEHDTSSFAEVGGLKNLKEWLEKRKKFLSVKCRHPVLMFPKVFCFSVCREAGKVLLQKL